MFTNNYILYQKARFLDGSYRGYVDFTGNTFQNYNVNNFFNDIGRSMLYARCRPISGYTGRYPDNFSSYNVYNGIYFGSGTTPATREDFTLEKPITSGLSVSNPGTRVWYMDSDTGQYSSTSDFIVRNTTDADIVISEIGIFCPMADHDTSKDDWDEDSTWRTVMMEHTILTQPITIMAGGARMISFTLTYNHTAGT